MSVDPFRLARFVEAQESDGTYDRALRELQAGRKKSHWMWFVFPQFAGLGQSPLSRLYSISSLDEATAYLAHRLLGARLRECATIVQETSATDAEEIFGETDALKLRSSMTLFSRAAPDQALFRKILDQYFGGRTDQLTDDLLRTHRQAAHRTEDVSD